MLKCTAPLLYINLCCECIYIIHQRIKAQSIDAGKSQIVLGAMVGYLFETQLNKIFEDGEPPTLNAARTLIEQMSNCSIMKLSGSSMDKLFDLVVMMFKYQITCSTELNQIQLITQRHLSVVEAIAAVSDPKPIRMAQPRVTSALRGLCAGELHRIRQALLRVLQDYRVKVSVLLEANIQNNNGSFKLPMPYSDRLGSVSLYNTSGDVESRELLPVYYGSNDRENFYNYELPLGSNIFDKSTVQHMDAHPPLFIGSPAVDFVHATSTIVISD